jgi:hypothetical protein
MIAESHSPPVPPVDLVDELRLRRWARLNYVSADERSRHWHPVIMDEMLRKDRELVCEEREHPGRSYAPIAPAVVEVQRRHAVGPPRFLASPSQISELHYT